MWFNSLPSVLPFGIEPSHLALACVACGGAVWVAPSWCEWWNLRKKRQQKRQTCKIAIDDLARRMQLSDVRPTV